MAEPFGHGAFDAGVRKPQAGARGVSRRAGLLSHTSSPQVLRTGPSKAAAAAVIARALSAVDVRMIGLLGTPPLTENSEASLLELALLSRIDRTLRAHSRALADDVVLCDSVAEFAESVHATLADLDTSIATRLPRFMHYLREMLAELLAHKSTRGVSLKDQLRAIQAQVAQSETSETHLRQALEKLQRLHQALSSELERVCPRHERALLDALVNPPTLGL